MEKFVQRFESQVNGVISGWDRLAIRGTIRWLSSVRGLTTYLSDHNILLKQFKPWVQAQTQTIRDACSQTAQTLGIRQIYLTSSSIDKEAYARLIAKQDNIETGPIVMFSVVEPSYSPTVVGSKATGKLEVVMRQRKCVWIYFYFNDPVLGFGHLRLQTWLPFTIKGCLNGRHWLERSLMGEGIDFIKDKNCFRWIGDVERAQQLLDEQLTIDWAQTLGRLLEQYFPVMGKLFGDKPLSYYWSVDESEWATDVMFRDTATLDRLFPMLARHALLTTDSASVMRFLGRIDAEAALPGHITGDIRGDRRRRHEGLCVKHWDGANSLKTYNKAGNVLRVETTINDPRAFKVYRAADDQPGAEPSWLPMRKGVADMQRRSRVSQASNSRYLNALAGCASGATVHEKVEGVCRRTKRNERSVRALNPCSGDDLCLLKFMAQGQWALNGLRNRDLVKWLQADADKLAPDVRRKLSCRAGRLLGILRAHGLIHKVAKTHRYHVTTKGNDIAQLMISAAAVQAEKLMELAA